MPPQPLLSFDFLKSQGVKFPIEEIRARNPQRYEMEHLSAIVHFDAEAQIIAGYKDVGEQEFWVRGHLPGRPLLPGVVMLEALAQLCSFYQLTIQPDAPFFGFGGLDEVRFRGTVVPGDRLYLIARALDIKARRGYYQTQGLVNGKLVAEAKVLGIAF